MRLKLIFALVAAMPLLAPAYWIVAPDTGSIEGIVTSQHGPVASAFVEAGNVMNGEVNRVVTDAAGHYMMTGLRPGRYTMWVKAKSGDGVWIPRVVVERGQVTHQDVRILSTAANGGILSPLLP